MSINLIIVISDQLGLDKILKNFKAVHNLQLKNILRTSGCDA